MRTVLCILVCCLMLLSCASAEQEVLLPGGRYAVDVPDWMEYSEPVDGDAGVEAYVSKDLEMDYISYQKAEMIRAEKGSKIELRKVNGIEMLCFRLVDEEDGTPCIGYLFEDGELLIEIDFWYATQEAADMTKTIMETIRTADSAQ